MYDINISAFIISPYFAVNSEPQFNTDATNESNSLICSLKTYQLIQIYNNGSPTNNSDVLRTSKVPDNVFVVENRWR